MNKRRYLALLLVAVFTIGTILVPKRNTYAAKKTKLNKKSATIEIGKTVTLKLKNAPKGKKIKWTSSKKKVAVVNRKGRVQGKSAGKAKITAKVGKKKYTCTVTVKKKEKPQQVTTEQYTNPIYQGYDIKRVNVNGNYYNVTRDYKISDKVTIARETPSDKVTINIENDYDNLMSESDSGINVDSKYLAYFGKITATDEDGNDISNNVVISEVSFVSGLVNTNIIAIYAEDSKGNCNVKMFNLNFDFIDPNGLKFLDNLDETEFKLIDTNPTVYARPRKNGVDNELDTISKTNAKELKYIKNC